MVRRTRLGGPRGFTLVELMVVLAIVGMLVALAMPRYLHSVERSRETVLQHDLRTMREAIDRFKADRGRYPASLDELAELHYLRKVPSDPITDSAGTWVLLPPPAGPDATGVYDVRSGAPGNALDGSAYQSW